jgi:hypothetical protein
MNDITKPLDTSLWMNRIGKDKVLPKEQQEAMEIMRKMEANSTATTTQHATNTHDGPNITTEGLLNAWKKVINKKSNLSKLSKEKLDEMRSAMKMTKVSIIIRIPKEIPSDFSAAEVHTATIRELSKQDSNLVVLDSSGVNHVNIHKAFTPEKYKQAFQPREKKFGNGTAQVSISHFVLSELESFNKTLLLPFLQRNKVFIYFNQREGLEHFAAIGVFFGPHPELTWRQDIVERIEKTMKADISESECKEINTNHQKPKIVISMVPQQISNQKHSKTTSLALEIRVPAAHERIYLNILERLNERASTLEEDEVDITLDDRLGQFFPYHAKRSRPELFESLMRKQNSEMNSVSAIPLFGITPEVLDTEVTDKFGKTKQTRCWIYDNPNVITMENTASSKELGKYMLVVQREYKEEVEDFIDNLFEQFTEFENTTTPFKQPQRGGNSFRRKNTSNIENYLNKLEAKVNEELSFIEDDELSTSPPPRPRKMTISYAQATRRLSFKNDETDTNNRGEMNSGATMATSMSTLTQSTLDQAMEKMRQEHERSIEKLRQDMQTKIQSMENSIATAVISAIRQTPSVVNMETESLDGQSMQSTQDTNATIKTLTDNLTNLANVVNLLSEKVIELSEKQEMQNKRSRPKINTTPRQLAQVLDNERQTQQSPPTKQPRASAPTPPTTPPPHGTPKVGAR